MCHEFQKSIKKKTAADAQQAEESKAIKILANEIKDGNTEVFMDQLLGKLENRRKRIHSPEINEHNINSTKEMIL